MNKKNGKWVGSATELLEQMSDEITYGIREKDLPKNAQTLSRKLNEVKATLEECGISINMLAGRERQIEIWKTGENIANIVTPSPEPKTNPLDYDNF